MHNSYCKNIFCIIFVLLFLGCSKNETAATVAAPTEPIIIVPVTETDPPQYGTPFNGVPSRPDAIIYQVNMRPYSTAGNFAGVINRLDSIKALGINVVYLMPIFPVGNVNAFNSPYCVKDYKAVNSEFGTLTDLRTLIDAAHSKNMSVILDWVANHTSWDNAWITNHRDWYLQNNNGAIVSPPGTGWNDVAQLNFSNAAMRLEMIKSMKYWVYTANIDGFRCDYADGPPVDFWAQAIDSLRKISTHKLLLLAEGSRSSNFSAGFDYNFGFGFFDQLRNIYNNNIATTALDNLNNSEYTNTTNGQQVVRYTSNHDINGSDGTPLNLFGGRNGSMAAFVITAYMKSIPMIYGSQEVGTPFKITFPFTSTKINWSINADITAEYKKILNFRANSNAIKRGTLISYSNSDVCAFTKEIIGEKVLVIVNTRNSIINYNLPIPLANTNWTDAYNGVTTTFTNVVVLQAHSYIVVKQ
jgi:glycosidase